MVRVNPLHPAVQLSKKAVGRADKSSPHLLIGLMVILEDRTRNKEVMSVNAAVPLSQGQVAEGFKVELGNRKACRAGGTIPNT